MIISPFRVFQIYIGIKTHFESPSYDYIKYRGSTRVKEVNFEKRRDKYFFVKLSKKFTEESDFINYFIANYLYDNKFWIGKLTDEAYYEWKGRIESLSYIFSKDVDYILYEINGTERLNDLVRVNTEKYAYPLIFYYLIQEKISLETFIIFDGIFKILEKNNIEDPVWDDNKKLINKYSKFLTIDLDKYNQILVSKFKNFGEDNGNSSGSKTN